MDDDETKAPAEPNASAETAAPAKAKGAHPAAWLLLGVGVTLAIVLTLRSSEEPPAAAPPIIMTSDEAEPLSSAQVRFAELYLSYLLKTYYVRRRGFCQPLLEKICQAMLRADLLTSPSSCRSLPNDRFVLAIGQYQNRVGLPVDGKAGPETVRMMLGGDFNSRDTMARAHCPGWSTPAPPAPDR